MFLRYYLKSGCVSVLSESVKHVMRLLIVMLVLSGSAALAACASPLSPSLSNCVISKPRIDTVALTNGIWINQEEFKKLLRYVADLEHCAGIE